jgi:DUF4097 and DUF4098 domain-containing protein YvlB
MEERKEHEENGCDSCFSSWALAASGQEAVDRRIEADPNGELEVSNVAGEVTVEGWEQNEVHVTGELGENVERLDVVAEEQRVIVRVVLNRDRNKYGPDWSGNGADLRIQAPRGMALDIDAVSADIEVRDMHGEQRISSVSGDIETQAYDAEVRAQAVSGDVRVDGRAEALMIRANTVSGDVTIDEVSGEVSAESVSGDVVLRTGMIERARAQTVSGEVLVTAALGEAARLEGRAVSGDVEFQFSGTGAADYRLETFSGEIENCFGPQETGLDDDRDSSGFPPDPPGRQLRFREGNTQARVEATTHSGDIYVCRE